MKVPPDHYKGLQATSKGHIPLLVSVAAMGKYKQANEFQWRHYGHLVINYSWAESAQYVIQGSPTLNGVHSYPGCREADQTVDFLWYWGLIAWGNQRGSCSDMLQPMPVTTNICVWGNHLLAWKFLGSLKCFCNNSSQMFWGLSVYCGCKTNWDDCINSLIMQSSLYHKEYLCKQSDCFNHRIVEELKRQWLLWGYFLQGTVLLAVMFQTVNTIRYFLTCHHVHSVKVHMVYDVLWYFNWVLHHSLIHRLLPM